MNTKSNKYQPPLNLRKYLQALLSIDAMGNKLEADRLSGVDRGRFYYHYKKHEEFRRWFSEQCDLFLGINESIPATALIKKVTDGDVGAIRLYYELRGKLKHAQQESSVNLNRVSGGNSTQKTEQEQAAERKRLIEDFRRLIRGRGV